MYIVYDLFVTITMTILDRRYMYLDILHKFTLSHTCTCSFLKPHPEVIFQDMCMHDDRIVEKLGLNWILFSNVVCCLRFHKLVTAIKVAVRLRWGGGGE